jgi:MoxR-like ATPase
MMFKNRFRKLDQILDNSDVTPEQKFFSSIYGYDDIKKLLLRCILAKEAPHVLLTGPPASSKTAFLLELLKGLDKTFFVDGTSTSGPGMTNYLFENNVRYLLIDEIDKLSRKDKSVLLTLMENSILIETKIGKTRKKEMNVSVFAPCNDISKIPNQLKSRFTVLELQEYT